MVWRANDSFHVLLRANRAVVLALLWVVLAGCILGSLVFDVADWLNALRDLNLNALVSAVTH